MSMFINGLNIGADYLSAVAKQGGLVIAPTVLGAIGGRLAGSWEMGLLQGFISGAFYSATLRPLRELVNANKGEGPGQIHQNTANWLWVAGKIAQYGVPVAFVVYAGNPILACIGKYVPWLAPSSASYTPMRAIAVNILPCVAQHVIEYMRGVDNKTHTG